MSVRNTPNRPLHLLRLPRKRLIPEEVLVFGRGEIDFVEVPLSLDAGDAVAALCLDEFRRFLPMGRAPKVPVMDGYRLVTAGRDGCRRNRDMSSKIWPM